MEDRATHAGNMETANGWVGGGERECVQAVGRLRVRCAAAWALNHAGKV